MKNYNKLSNKKIHELWNNPHLLSKEIVELRKQLVKRDFVSQEELNTKWEAIIK